MRAVIVYMAMSADGFIAGSHDETPWSDDEWMSFSDFVAGCDVCLLGRKTYEIMRAGGEFVDGPNYVVVSRDSHFDSGKFAKRAIASAADMPAGERIGVIGGGELNGSLAKLGLIDELILDVEPVILGQGKRLFGDCKVRLDLQLIGSKRIGTGTVQNRYKVLR